MNNHIKGYVYMLISPSGKEYIGRTIDIKRRVNNYKTRCNYVETPIYQEIKKYGFDNFQLDILKEITGEREEVEEQLNKLEGYYIAKHRTSEIGLNVRNFDGKIRTYTLKDSTKEKMKRSQTGRKHSLESRQKRAGENAYQSRKVHSEKLGETFNSLREAAKYAGLTNGCKISEFISGKRKSAGKHPETKEPLNDWKFV
ncbi:GIY-YIG nuclease family protein [Bacillus mycoides]